MVLDLPTSLSADLQRLAILCVQSGWPMAGSLLLQKIIEIKERELDPTIMPLGIEVRNGLVTHHVLDAIPPHGMSWVAAVLRRMWGQDRVHDYDVEVEYDKLKAASPALREIS